MAHVLITGCSSGFGLLTALRCARAGDRVFATMRTPAAAPDLRRTAEAERLALSVHRLDVCDPASIAAALAEVTAAGGTLDVLVNNAGIECRSSIEDAADEDVRRQFETNVFGTLNVIRAVLPGMRARRRGTIVNVSSVAGLVARPYGGLYSATKHALEAISEALHFEVQPFGLRVVVIEPGYYGTRLLDNAYSGRQFTPASPYWAHSQRFEDALARLRAGGAADAQEVADLIHDAVHANAPRLRYLAGEDAHLIATAHKQMDFERYEGAMRARLDWQD